MTVTITKVLVLLGLTLNLIGAILLSIPTVGGAIYIQKIARKASLIFENLSIALFLIGVLYYILIFVIGVDQIYFYFNDELKQEYLNAISSMSSWETVKYTSGLVFKKTVFALAVILVFFVLSVIALKIENWLDWLTGSSEQKKEQERRIGWLGIKLLVLGFLLQIFLELYTL